MCTGARPKPPSRRPAQVYNGGTGGPDLWLPGRSTPVAARRTAPIARSSLVALLAVAAMVLTGAASCTPEPAPTPTVTVTVVATAEPTVEPTAEETAAPEVPAGIILTATAIGDVAIGTPGALPALLKLLGPADDDGSGIERPGNDDCGGPGNLTYVWWGQLHVIFTSGALFGWDLRGTDVPTGVITQHGVMPGAPYTDVVAIPGAPAPQFQDNFQNLLTYIDDIGYWSTEGSDPAATTLNMVAVSPITCG